MHDHGDGIERVRVNQRECLDHGGPAAGDSIGDGIAGFSVRGADIQSECGCVGGDGLELEFELRGEFQFAEQQHDELDGAGGIDGAVHDHGDGIERVRVNQRECANYHFCSTWNTKPRQRIGRPAG